MDPSLQEKKVAHVCEKFGQNLEILQTKLQEIKELYSEMKIRFRDFEGVEELKLSENQGLKDRVSGHWRLDPKN